VCVCNSCEQGERMKMKYAQDGQARNEVVEHV